MPFEKGKSGNPAGRPRISKKVQTFRKAARDKVAKTYDKLTKIPISEVERIHKDSKTQSLEASMAGIILKAYTDKDFNALEAMFNRMFGKVKDIQEYQGKVTTVDKLPTGTEMISSSMRIAQNQLHLLESKARQGIDLSESEQRSIATLGKTVIELTEAESRLRKGSPLAQMSDKDLLAMAKDAQKAMDKGKLATIKPDKDKAN